MNVEIVKDPACACVGCEAERRVKSLVDEMAAAMRFEVARIMEKPYHDERAIADVRRRYEHHIDGIMRTMGRFLIGCSNIAIRVSAP